MQNNIYLYLVDNKLQIALQKEKKIKEFSLSKKVIEYGKVIHRPKFTRELGSIFKKNHIIKKFQKNNLYVITPPNFNEVDKEIWIHIFEDLPIQKISCLKEVNYYQLKKNTLWINLNREYAYITYLEKHHNKIELLKDNYLCYNFLEQLKLFLKANPRIKKVYLFGNNSDINNIRKKLENETGKIIFYFESPKNYLLIQVFRHNIS